MTAYVVTTAVLFLLGAGMDMKAEKEHLPTIAVQIGLASWALWLVLR